MEIDAVEAEKIIEELLERAERGEEVIITRDGVPVARLERAPDSEPPPEQA